MIDYIFYAPGEGAGALRPVARWAEPSVARARAAALPVETNGTDCSLLLSSLYHIARWPPLLFGSSNHSMISSLPQEDIGPGALPCSGYPSDHLAQLVEFEWGGPPAADGGAEKDDGGAAAAD